MSAVFVANKYLRWYEQLIERARARPHGEGMERHHVVPKSLGGTNERSNVVSLAYREHFLAHWLLTKFTSGQDLLKMRRALSAMTWISRTHQRLVAGWQYAVARRCLPHMGKALGLSGKGKKKTDEHRQRISAALLGLPKSDEHRAKLALHRPSDEQRQRISETSKGRKHSPESLERIRLASSGRKHSDETRAKLSAALSGRQFDADWCAKISASLKGKRLGIPHSPEHRAKLVEAAKRRLRDKDGCFAGAAA